MPISKSKKDKTYKVHESIVRGPDGNGTQTLEASGSSRLSPPYFEPIAGYRTRDTYAFLPRASCESDRSTGTGRTFVSTHSSCTNMTFDWSTGTKIQTDQRLRTIKSASQKSYCANCRMRTTAVKSEHQVHLIGYAKNRTNWITDPSRAKPSRAEPSHSVTLRFEKLKTPCQRNVKSHHVAKWAQVNQVVRRMS